MVPYSTPELLALMEDTPTGTGALAILCFSPDWQGPEQQTLWLAIRLHEKGRVLTLLVRDNSVLHQQAQAQGLPCRAFPADASPAKLRTVVHLGRWLRQQAIELLLTTRLADLGLAGLLKRWSANQLLLLHRQFEPVYPCSGLRQWWLNWRLRTVDAWLSPLVRSGQQMLAHTPLSGRQLWVVPPAVLPYFTNDDDTARQQGRSLLKLPAATQLIGVVDCGGDGPAFALEVLYRLQQEHNSDAEVVIMGHPATQADLARWAALRELAQQLHLSHRVHLRSLQHTATPLLLYSPLNVLLLPSSQDATCLPVLEAMASGCPLVSAHTADAADLLLHGHTARLFPPHDVAACAKQLFVALSAPAQSLLLAERAAAHVRHFYDPVQQSQQLESILEYVCQRQA